MKGFIQKIIKLALTLRKNKLMRSFSTMITNINTFKRKEKKTAYDNREVYNSLRG